MELERPQSIQCVTYAQFCGHKANTRSIANAWQTLLKNTWPPDLMWGQERGGYVSYQIPVHKMVVQIILWLQCNRHLSFHSGCLNSNTYIPNNTKKVRVGTFWKKDAAQQKAHRLGFEEKNVVVFFKKNIFEPIVGGIEIFLTPSKIFFAEQHTFSQEKLRYISKKTIDIDLNP